MEMFPIQIFAKWVAGSKLYWCMVGGWLHCSNSTPYPIVLHAITKEQWLASIHFMITPTGSTPAILKVRADLLTNLWGIWWLGGSFTC